MLIRCLVLFGLLFLPEALLSQSLTIAFGSCSRQDLTDKQMWKEVIATTPDVWVWTGDNIYADTRDMAVMRQMYEKQKSHPDYQELLKTATVYGTWDDHDYGVNDGGKEFKSKQSSKEELLRFLDVPGDAAVRTHEGVYQSYDLKAGDQTVRLILLDTRYFRDKLTSSGKAGQRYEQNPEGDILGEEQWKWLEGELTRPGASVRMLVTSIQLIPEEQGFEKWANFPSARARFMELINRTTPEGLFLVSGDRHMAETSRVPVQGLGYPLTEFTSSGLTHTWTRPGDEPNKRRIGNLVLERNFGLIRFFWEKGKVRLHYQVIGPSGIVLSEEHLAFLVR
ncbi:MAG: alkaline phosphatase D family protein [Bacteroidota bacterium]